MALQSRATPVLITRPQPQADDFAHLVTERFRSRAVPVISPLMAPQFLPVVLPPGLFAAVIFTSQTGIRAATRLQADGVLLPRRAFCVGGQTAILATKAGFDAISANGDAHALIRLVREHPDSAPLLHLRGTEAAGAVCDALNSAGISADEAIVYTQQPQPLTAAALSLFSLEGRLVLPLFSPRSAQILHRQTTLLPIAAQLHIAAISAAVAAVAQQFPHAALHVASTPDASGMLDMTELCLFGA